MDGQVASQRDPGLRQVVVTRKSMESEDVAAFRLADINNMTLPPFTAGAHVDVHIASGLTRQYSLCNAPDERDSYLIAIKREVASRGGSKTMHDEIHIGSTLWISNPRNNFPISEEGKHSVLIAGGIGITPILCMAHQLRRDGRSFQLDYFVRSREQAAFRNILERVDWAESVRFHLGLDRLGTVNRLKTRLLRRPDDAHLYMCGPNAFMECVAEVASRRWPSESLHKEFFSLSQALQNRDDVGFTVILAKRNTEIVVPPGQSIVDALQNAGVSIDVSCRQGICGTCIAEILEGEADHRDAFLSADERVAGKCMLPCVSRAKSSRIVLNL